MLVVDEGRDLIGRPYGGVGMELARVDGQSLGGELVDDARVAEGVHSDSHRGLLGSYVAAEGLADADLGRAVGRILVADHPEGDHAKRIVGCLGTHLEEAVAGCVEAEVLLGPGRPRPG